MPAEKLVSRFKDLKDGQHVDYLVVGSGIGGLTIANWLAAAGKQVTVLEKHYRPGGLTHTFKRKNGLQWDVGVHYMGNLAEGEGLQKLFDFVFDKKVKWNYMGSTYDQVRIGSKVFNFKAGKEEFIDQMVEYFPEERQTIEEYIKVIFKANKKAQMFFAEKAFNRFFSKYYGWMLKSGFKKYANRTTKEVLDSLSDNKLLKAVLSAQCGNYGLTPGKSSFAAHALIVGHFMEGGYYPEGGSDKLADAAIEKLNKLNGEVYINSGVDEIQVDNGRIKGVVVNGKKISCSNVISNVGLRNTNALLSSENKLYQNLDLVPSTGHFCLYVGLEGSADELGLPKHNIWSFDHEEFDDIFDNSTIDNIADRFAYISFPSAKDESWKSENPNTSTIQVVTMAKYEWIDRFKDEPWMNRSDEYNKIKEKISNQLINKVHEMYPSTKGKVIYKELSTPLSTEKFTSYQSGEIYGIAHDKKRFSSKLLRPRTKIKGLYMVGQDITVVGVAGAMMSGLICACVILKFKVGGVFKSIFK